MAEIVSVLIHASQFPQNVQRDLLESLRQREINHKFHYDSVKQTQKWLALHAAHSPWQTEPDCRETYDRAFRAAAGRMVSGRLHVIGMGCGSGQKDLVLLQRLKENGRKLSYTPCDVSTAMVLTARQTVAALLGDEECLPFVCDLQTADDLQHVFDQQIPTDACRLVTFFGMLPNFAPVGILARVAGLVGARDYLLLSANLVPGRDYAAGMQRILPQYDNPLTREWLLSFPLDLGVEREDGAIQFLIEDCPHGSGLKRVSGGFRFRKRRTIHLDAERFDFQPGESIRLFFSYRHTPEHVVVLARRAGMSVIEQWITGSEDEGIFLCQRQP